MSLFEQVYDCTDRYTGAPLAPPDEAPELVCPECGALLLSSQLVRQEGLFHDVVGCEECSEWQAVDALGAPPESCPNCGEALEDGAMLLVSDGAVPLACDCCASDGLAVYHCRDALASILAGGHNCGPRTFDTKGQTSEPTSTASGSGANKIAYAPRVATNESVGVVKHPQGGCAAWEDTFEQEAAGTVAVTRRPEVGDGGDATTSSVGAEGACPAPLLAVAQGTDASEAAG